MSTTTERFSFKNTSGQTLSARIDLPLGPIRYFGLYVHCFTCSKDVLPASRICRFLAEKGIAMMRFDLTGLGASEGDFVDTNFTTQVDDVLGAIDAMQAAFKTPALLIGHSLGGTVALAAASRAPSIKAAVSINAPSHPVHTKKRFTKWADEIRANGKADVLIEDRPFVIKKQFIDNLESIDMESVFEALKAPVLLMHAPDDTVVLQQNGFDLFGAIKGVKSFFALPNADHLLSNPSSSAYAASIIDAWAAAYIQDHDVERKDAPLRDFVIVKESGDGPYTQDVFIGPHRLKADEPLDIPGGLDFGPAPYDYLMSALGACTSITLRMYANRKNMALASIEVHVRHGKEQVPVGADGALQVAEELKGAVTDVFTRSIKLTGSLNEEERASLFKIAEKCPVHKTLSNRSIIRSVLVEA
jgi:uncharacterized OsmC-like protein/pimeloyl-ACP methyl ester carboxylesterase